MVHVVSQFEDPNTLFADVEFGTVMYGDFIFQYISLSLLAPKIHFDMSVCASSKNESILFGTGVSIIM